MIKTFKIGNINFKSTKDFNLKSKVEEIIILKPKHVLDKYIKMLPRKQNVTILDLGIHEAGSAIALCASHPTARVLGIDFKNKKYLDDIISTHGLSNRIHLYHNIKQEDEDALREIIKKECIYNGLDMIIDDCSHFYEETRASFEVLFPYLKRGGQYIIEDWNWAHAPGEYQTTKWIDKPALTNLIFELTILYGTGRSGIKEILLSGNSTILTKCSETNPANRLDIKNNVLMRNKKLVHI